MSYRDSWGGILSKHVQFRCKICADGVGDAADIVCADAWHGDEQGYPTFSEAEGRSLILSRTKLGEEVLQSAIDAREISVQPLDISEIPGMQPGQVSRMRMLVARMAALWVTAQPRPEYVGFNLLPAARGASLWMLLRNFLGTGRRVILGRR
jgi:coenzyme F420 hydrogenase subunit beta